MGQRGEVTIPATRFEKVFIEELKRVQNENKNPISFNSFTETTGAQVKCGNWQATVDGDGHGASTMKEAKRLVDWEEDA